MRRIILDIGFYAIKRAYLHCVFTTFTEFVTIILLGGFPLTGNVGNTELQIIENVHDYSLVV